MSLVMVLKWPANERIKKCHLQSNKSTNGSTRQRLQSVPVISVISGNIDDEIQNNYSSDYIRAGHGEMEKSLVVPYNPLKIQAVHRNHWTTSE